MADNKVIELPVGKLVETVNKDGSISYRGSSADLRAWEQREHGIDDAQRAARAARNKDLGKMMSDFMTERLLEAGAPQVDVALGMGDGAEKFKLVAKKTVHYPVTKDDGTVERAEKTVYGAMEWKTQQQPHKDVRDHHSENQAKIEASLTKDMDKASIK